MLIVVLDMGQDAKGGWVKCQSYNLYGKIKSIYVGSFLAWLFSVSALKKIAASEDTKSVLRY
jgi:hypothetical protein